MYMSALSSSEHQKSFDFTTDGGEPCAFWELNLETVEEKPVPSTSESSLQPIYNSFLKRRHATSILLLPLLQWGSALTAPTKPWV